MEQLDDCLLLGVLLFALRDFKVALQVLARTLLLEVRVQQVLGYFPFEVRNEDLILAVTCIEVAFSLKLSK